MELIKVLRIVINSTILTSALISSFIGAVIFYIIISKCDVKQIDKIVMLVVTLSDLLWAFYMIFASILKLVLGQDYIKGESLNCQLYVFFNTFNLRVSNGCVAILAIMRYCVGCKKKDTPKWKWIALFGFHIFVCISLSTITFVRWDGRRTSSGLICLPFLTPGVVSKVFSLFHTFYYLCLCSLVFVFYILICRHWYIYLESLRIESKLNMEQERTKAIIKQQRNLLYQGSLVILSDTITFVPSAVTYVMKLFFGYTRPPVVDAFMIWTLTILPIVNPIITLWLQPEVNMEFWALHVKFKARLVNIFKKATRM